MYELIIEDHFSAAHHLRGYPGNCSHVHGHNWLVKLHVQAKQVNEIGLAIDFKKLKPALAEVLETFDHKDINSLPVFANVNPTCENMAHILYQMLSERLNDDNIRVCRVEVYETPRTGAAYYE